MARRLIIGCLFFALTTGVLSCSSDPDTDTQHSKPSAQTHWPGEFSLIVGDLAIIPGKTMLSEVTAKLGKPSQQTREDVVKEIARGRILWDCDVSTRTKAIYALKDGAEIVVTATMRTDNNDGVVISALARGNPGSTPPRLGTGGALGGQISTTVAELMPHFEAAADLPRLEAYQAWKPERAPLVGTVDYTTIGKLLSWNDPGRNKIERASKWVDASRTYAVIRPWWKVEADMEGKVVAISVEIPLGPPSWHETLELAERNHWNALRRDRSIAENAKRKFAQ
ncbi:MAG: hypothetical protein HUU29_08125 [Planctomycetaceae bacterium]|nr:hypothetical protein [Planctomycetaceae bacterium]